VNQETVAARNWTIFIYTFASILLLLVVIGLLANKLWINKEYYEPPEFRYERIKPIGQVKVQSAQAVAQAPVVEEKPAAPKPPKEIYDTLCTTCHSIGVAGAPKFGDQAAWADRIAKGKEALVNSAINGLGAMPPRGGGNFTDEEIKATVEYMLEAVSDGGADDSAQLNEENKAQQEATAVTEVAPNLTDKKKTTVDNEAIQVAQLTPTATESDNEKNFLISDNKSTVATTATTENNDEIIKPVANEATVASVPPLGQATENAATIEEPAQVPVETPVQEESVELNVATTQESTQIPPAQENSVESSIAATEKPSVETPAQEESVAPNVATTEESTEISVETPAQEESVEPSVATTEESTQIPPAQENSVESSIVATEKPAEISPNQEEPVEPSATTTEESSEISVETPVQEESVEPSVATTEESTQIPPAQENSVESSIAATEKPAEISPNLLKRNR
jgi:cytochrome c5